MKTEAHPSDWKYCDEFVTVAANHSFAGVSTLTEAVQSQLDFHSFDRKTMGFVLNDDGFYRTRQRRSMR